MPRKIRAVWYNQDKYPCSQTFIPVYGLHITTVVFMDFPIIDMVHFLELLYYP